MLLVVLFIYYYQERIHYYKVELVKSDIDNKSYLVRVREDNKEAANLLAKISMNMYKLDKYLFDNIKKFPKYEKYIKQLNKKLKNSKIQESTDNGIYTSYSINKGEQLVFCLRSRKDSTGKIHDLNLLMYVVLHEMAHVGCPEFGHTELFKDIFGFFTTEAIKLGIYKKIDFKTENTEYCGLTITDSIV
jgi:hypothetical protein